MTKNVFTEGSDQHLELDTIQQKMCVATFGAQFMNNSVDERHITGHANVSYGELAYSGQAQKNGAVDKLSQSMNSSKQPQNALGVNSKLYRQRFPKDFFQHKQDNQNANI